MHFYVTKFRNMKMKFIKCIPCSCTSIKVLFKQKHNNYKSNKIELYIIIGSFYLLFDKDYIAIVISFLP